MTACCPFSGNTFKQIFLLFVFSHNSLRSMLLTVITSERSLLATQNTISLSVTLFPCFSSVQFSSVQSLSHVRLFVTLEFTQTHVHRVGDAIQPSHPLFSPSLPALNPSQHQVFSNESTLRMRWPKYWGFSFSISPSKERQD